MKTTTLLDKLSYDGKRVIVTGAASGIGAATAEVLADLGAEVIAMDIAPCCGPGRYVRVDMLDQFSIEDAVRQAGGPIHGLFASAGLGSKAPCQNILMCNFVGMRHMIDHGVPLMARGSAITIVASTGGSNWRDMVEEVRGLVESPDFSTGRKWVASHADALANPYGASKRAVRLYSVLKARQLAPMGIRINTISPHATVTPMYLTALESADELTLKYINGLGGKTGLPEDQAYAMAFLNSDAAGHITGTDLAVDGGFLVDFLPGTGETILPPLLNQSGLVHKS